jgi:protein TonB
MFENYEHDRGGARRPRRWVRVGIIASAIAHVGVAIALVVSAWWKIDKLSIDDDRTIGVASFGLATAAPPPLAAKQRDRIKKELHRTRDLTQNVDRDRSVEDAGGGEGSPDGQDGGIPGGQGDDPNAKNLFAGSCGQAICLDPTPPTRQVEQEPEPAPPVVPEAMLKGHLINGDTQIQASRSDRIKIARLPDRRVVGVVKLCISDAGAVTSSQLLKSTGFADYDRRLVRGVRRWRYKPYRVGGKPAAVCTSVRFVYILND